MENILIIFYSNQSNFNGHKNYIKTLKHYGYTYKQIGEGQEWKGFVDSKIKECYEYLKNMKNKKTIVCVTDVFDILAIAPPNNLYTRFKSFNSPLVFGVENSDGKLHQYPGQDKDIPKNMKRRFINGGFYMGYIDNILEMYKHILSLKNKVKEDNDDQYCMGHYITTQNVIFKRDYYCKLVYNIEFSLSSNYKIIEKYGGKTLIVNDTKNIPCFVHGPGYTAVFHLGKIAKTLFPNENMESYPIWEWLAKYKIIIYVVFVLIFLLILIPVIFIICKKSTVKKLE